MENKELLDKFINEKVAIATRTQEEYNDFMELLEKETDLRWSRGENPTEYKDLWHYEKHETAVVCGFFKKGEISFSDKGFYKEQGYEIIEYKDLIKGDKGMKTSEFIKRVEELGYEVDNGDNIYIRVMHDEEIFAYIDKRKNYHIDTTISYEEMTQELFDLLVEYARTPIEEREEEPKYYWKIKGLGSLQGENYKYFNYYNDEKPILDSKENTSNFRTHFTEKEFKEICEKHNITAEFENEEIK